MKSEKPIDSSIDSWGAIIDQAIKRGAEIAHQKLVQLEAERPILPEWRELEIKYGSMTALFIMARLYMEAQADTLPKKTRERKRWCKRVLRDAASLGFLKQKLPNHKAVESCPVLEEIVLQKIKVR